jgi:hypothetical protein
MRFDAFFCRARRSEAKIVVRPAKDRSASAGLTTRQWRGAFCVDPEPLHDFKTTARIAPAR